MAIDSRPSDEMQGDLSPTQKVASPALAVAKDNASVSSFSLLRKSFEKAEGEDVPKERTTPSPTAQSRLSLKRSPTSTRSSMEIFRSSRKSTATIISKKEENNDNDDNDDARSKQGSISVCDSGTTTSNDERRLSDKVKKAWRGVTGQRGGDPLEQWMVKHSGGTLRDVPKPQGSREPGREPDGR